MIYEHDSKDFLPREKEARGVDVPTRSEVQL